MKSPLCHRVKECFLFFDFRISFGDLVKQERSRGATIKDVPEPQLVPGHVLARVKVASICGTDAHIYEWNNWASSRVEPPRVMGHEFAAVVEEIGEGVESVRKGDLISGETHIYCGHC